MEIKSLKKEKDKIVFVLKGADYVFANTLRRLMISEVPVLAIKKVTFVKNTSALFDEIIAHRLGLLPIITDIKSYRLPERCTCKGKGCAKCQMTFKLICEGPLTVYAKDLKSSDPKIKPVYGEIPVVKLLKGQELELEATASLGIGKEHSKFSPGLVWYKGMPKIKVDPKCNGCGDCVKECPIDILSVQKRNLIIKNLETCHLCKACQDSCPKDALEISSSEKDFIFTIESFGQLPPKEILAAALDVFDDRLNEFSTKLKKAK